ncbi:MAG: hypothetical protein J6B93_04310 [Clostridia bacterium]|nr:hypothetical protein [Clostridia bacterium]
MANVFGFTVTGTNINQKTGKPNTVSGIYNNGITVFAPNTDAASAGNILPVVYTREKDADGKATGPVIPTYTATTSSRSAMDFGEVLDAKTNEVTAKAIDVGEWVTIKARFIGNKLLLEAWQSDDKAGTYRRQFFTVPMDAVNNITEGDFMIVNGDNTARIRNIVIRDMSTVRKLGK